MKVRSVCKLSVLPLLGGMLAHQLQAQPYGLAADHDVKAVNVFDIATKTVVATIPIGSTKVVGDTAITPDQTLGFVTDYNFGLWVIDLTTSPPSLATGSSPNPVPISNLGEDISITPDGNFVLVSDGGNVQPIEVISIGGTTLDDLSSVDTFSTGTDTNSVGVCDDGVTVLVTSDDSQHVRTLALDPATGVLTSTSYTLTGMNPNNVYCAPGSGSGVVVTRENTEIQSFTVPDLTPVDTRALASFGISAVFSPSGDRIFVRSTGIDHTAWGVFGPGGIEEFGFDPATGALSAMPNQAVSIANAPSFFGMEQIALSGTELYVPEGDPVYAVTTFDASDLSSVLTPVVHSNIVAPTGISVAESFASADSEPPIVYDTAIFPNPVAVNTAFDIAAVVDDSATENSVVASASFTIDGGASTAMVAADSAFDEPVEDVIATVVSGLAVGVYDVCVTGTDAAANASDASCVLLSVYDPDAGYVTGHGWIDSPVGAYASDPAVAGRARFGLVSKYRRGSNVPVGKTSFHFQAAGLRFSSDVYEWLVVAGARAQFKGIGTINGSGNYGFMVTVVDEALTPSTSDDLVRIKIWNIDDNDQVVYDNQMGDSDEAPPATAIAAGAIMIHTP